MKPDFPWIGVLRLRPYLYFLRSHMKRCTFYLSKALTAAFNWLSIFRILLLNSFWISIPLSNVLNELKHLKI